MKFRSCMFLLPGILILSGCHRHQEEEPRLMSIQVIDKNGFSETISSKDRLEKYRKTDFLAPQPYQKVLRVFEKNPEGKSPSCITEYHPNGLLKQYLEVTDGRAHGYYRQWHPNGKLAMEFRVIEGMADLSETAFGSWVLDGRSFVYDDTGALIADISYEKGMLHGDCIAYHPNGAKKKYIPYVKDKVEGVVEFGSPQGIVTETLTYASNRLHGQSRGQTSSGILLYEEEWKEGKLLQGKYYTGNGSLFSEVSDGTGRRAEWENEILRTVIEYRNGDPEGLVEIFDEKGNLTSSYEQKEGKKEGEEILYYPSKPGTEKPRPKISLRWQEDMLQGTVRTWSENGVQESQREMYQNKKNGPALAWYRNGTVMLREEYENDLLLSGSYYKKGDKKSVSQIINGKGIATLFDPEGFFLKKIPYEKGLPVPEDTHER